MIHQMPLNQPPALSWAQFVVFFLLTGSYHFPLCHPTFQVKFLSTVRLIVPCICHHVGRIIVDWLFTHCAISKSGMTLLGPARRGCGEARIMYVMSLNTIPSHIPCPEDTTDVTALHKAWSTQCALSKWTTLVICYFLSYAPSITNTNCRTPGPPGSGWYPLKSPLVF